MIVCGLVEGTAGNVSARLPDGNVVLTPSSIDYGAMTLGDLVVTDISGNVLEGEKTPTTEKSLHLGLPPKTPGHRCSHALPRHVCHYVCHRPSAYTLRY